MLSSLASIGGITPIHQLSADEIKKFRPRPLTGRIKLSSNGNLFGPSEKVRQAMISNFDEACRYPFHDNEVLLKRIAFWEGVSKKSYPFERCIYRSLKSVGLTCGINRGEIIAAKLTFLAVMIYAAQWGGSINWVPVNKNMVLDLDEM